MKIFNLGVGVLNDRKNFTAYFLNPKNKAINDVYKNLRKSVNNISNLKNNCEKFNVKRLISEDPYWIDINELSSNDLFDNCSFIPLAIESISKGEPAFNGYTRFSFDEEMKNNLTKANRYSKISCLISELENGMVLLSYINTRSSLKNPRLMGFEVNKDAFTLNNDYTIHIPQEITACFDKDKLYVFSPVNFDAMLGLNQTKLEQAKSVLNKFINGDYKLLNENYTVEFEDKSLIQNNLCNRIRNINRLSSYEDKSLKIEKDTIEYAVNQLQADKRIIFDDKNKKIKVNDKSFNTFVAMLNDSIVQRVISGDYDIV